MHENQRKTLEELACNAYSELLVVLVRVFSRETKPIERVYCRPSVSAGHWFQDPCPPHTTPPGGYQNPQLFKSHIE